MQLIGSVSRRFLNRVSILSSFSVTNDYIANVNLSKYLHYHQIKDEFLDVIYWMRQILGLLLGIIWGIVPLKGFIGLALFLLVNVAIVYIYYNSFQKIDEEEFGGTSEILKEGLMTSFSSFLVAWIILYSALHSE